MSMCCLFLRISYLRFFRYEVLFLVSLCSYSQSSSNCYVWGANIVELFPVKKSAVIKVKDDFDLQGKTYLIPEGVILLSEGGVIKNGTLIGQNTIIKGNKPLFDEVKIRGVWNVEYIYSSLFRDLSKVNSLKQLFALANPNQYNYIKIEKGKYLLEAYNKDYKVLKVPSNTTVVIDGTLLLNPNNLKKYSVISIENAVNVCIKGSGTVIGDKDLHLDKVGEWGMCIGVRNSDKITISNLHIKKAWGDGIYIGKGSGIVDIRGCIIDSCRRQGISLIAGTKINVRNCTITNVAGTRPGYAIDIEPNKYDTITNVQIHNIVVDNCNGGVSFTSLEKNKCLINQVEIKNCKITRTIKVPIRLRGANNVKVDKCNISNCSSDYIFTTSRSKNVSFTNNTISTQKYVFYDINDFENYGNKILKGTKVPMITKKKLKEILK